MPYEWITEEGANAPRATLHAWPYRSLPRRGFVIFIAASVGLTLLPVSALIGTVVLWGILPFLCLVIGGVWIALERSYRDGELVEELEIWHDRIVLHRHDTRAGTVRWEANPHWVRPTLYRDQKIERYLTLRGGPREVELGAFLTPDERQALYHELNARLEGL